MDAALLRSTLSCWTPELRGWLEDAARRAGFALAGIAAVPGPADVIAARDTQRLSAWIEAGRAGEMDYLKRRTESGELLRSSIHTAFPWARSVIVCAYHYNAVGPQSINPAAPENGWIARYAWSGRATDDGATVPTDYHSDLLARLRCIESGLLAQTSCETRCYVDTGPVVERSQAVQAGIGWIGKNTCLIHQQLGSWLLLSVIVTSLPLEDSDAVAAPREPQAAASFALAAADRCGTCTRCIDACPTGALLGSRSPTAGREMDASRCIAYLTIEKKGDIPEALRGPIGRNVFGCDICQEVCPWNAKAAARSSIAFVSRSSGEGAMRVPPMHPRPELINPALEWLARMDAREFRRRFRGSPLERTGRKRLLRNVAIAMGNSGDERYLPQLKQWADVEDNGNRNDLALSNAAAWARGRILAARNEQNEG